MGDRHHDSLETRDPDDRERDFFGRLPDLIALALSAPGWASPLAGVDPNAVTSRAARARFSRPTPRPDRAALERAGLRTPPRRRRPQCRPRARGAPQPAAAAQTRARNAQEGAPAVRRLQRGGDRSPAAAVDVAGTDLRAAGRGRGFLGGGARALRRGLPRGAWLARFGFLSSDPQRLQCGSGHA